MAAVPRHHRAMGCAGGAALAPATGAEGAVEYGGREVLHHIEDAIHGGGGTRTRKGAPEPAVAVRALSPPAPRRTPIIVDPPILAVGDAVARRVGVGGIAYPRVRPAGI